MSLAPGNYVDFEVAGFKSSRAVPVQNEAVKDFSEIPIIDCRDIYSPDPAVRRALASAVGTAARDVGFLYAKTPLSERTRDDLMEQIELFFHQPVEVKQQQHVDHSPAARGWAPRARPDGKPGFIRETYDIGPDYLDVEQAHFKAAAPGTVPLNQFPDETLPAFRKCFYTYFTEVTRFSQAVVRLFALDMGLDEHRLDPFFTHPLFDVNIQHYPKVDAGEKGLQTLASHADHGFLTVLSQAPPLFLRCTAFDVVPPINTKAPIERPFLSPELPGKPTPREGDFALDRIVPEATSSVVTEAPPDPPDSPGSPEAAFEQLLNLGDSPEPARTIWSEQKFVVEELQMEREPTEGQEPPVENTEFDGQHDSDAIPTIHIFPFDSVGIAVIQEEREEVVTTNDVDAEERENVSSIGDDVESSIMSTEWGDVHFPAPKGFVEDLKQAMLEVGEEDLAASDEMAAQAQIIAYESAQRVHDDESSIISRRSSVYSTGPFPTIPKSPGARSAVNRRREKLSPRGATRITDSLDDIAEMLSNEAQQPRSRMAPSSPSLESPGQDSVLDLTQFIDAVPDVRRHSIGPRPVASYFAAEPGQLGSPTLAASPTITATSTFSSRLEPPNSPALVRTPSGKQPSKRKSGIFSFGRTKSPKEPTPSFSPEPEPATRQRARSIDSGSSSVSATQSPSARRHSFFGGTRPQKMNSIDSEISDHSYVDYGSLRRRSMSQASDIPPVPAIPALPVSQTATPRRSCLRQDSKDRRRDSVHSAMMDPDRSVFSVRFGNVPSGLGLRSVAEDEAAKAGGEDFGVKWVGVGRGRYGNLQLKVDEATDETYAEQVAVIKKKWRSFGSGPRDWSAIKSRISVPPDMMYSAASAVLLNELLKFAISSDCWKLSIPACLYVVQNNLQFVAASNLDVPTFQVTYNLKILTTALCSVVMLGRRLSGKKWVALALLAGGVALVQLQAATAAVRTVSTSHHPDMNRVKGLSAVVAACITSGLAGVYFEMVLKGSKVDLWIRNVQLSIFSIPPAFLPVFFPNFALFNPAGVKPGPPQAIFAYFGVWAWAVVLTQTVGGLVTALVIKYSDNIVKGFATSLAILISSVAGFILFDFRMTPAFLVGATIVVTATYMYNSPDRLPNYIPVGPSNPRYSPAIKQTPSDEPARPGSPPVLHAASMYRRPSTTSGTQTPDSSAIPPSDYRLEMPLDAKGVVDFDARRRTELPPR
ncbi:UDP-galactose transporter [Pseudohyphozyma bogoriensis]|nr:UDP-galactose transporter [Pseudohyphozyma bogoriensis]